MAPESPLSRIVEAAGFIIFTRSETPRFLLMKHATRWDLPKGHAEHGEQLLQTALRETEEETGIAAKKISVDPDFSFTQEYNVSSKKWGDYRKRVTYFLGFVEQPYEVAVTEHIGYQWFQWPVQAPIQAQSIDPLLAAVAEHFHRYPDRLAAEV